MTNTDLDELLNVHVRYELDMLFGTFDQLQYPVYNAIVGNALIESFCIHARALLDFFENAQGLKASEFTETTYSPLSKSQLGISDGVTGKLNTQIAHLTKKRVDEPRLKIGVDERRQLNAGLRRALEHFEAHLLPVYRARWKTYSLPLMVTVVGDHASATNAFQATTTGPTIVTMVNSIAVTAPASKS